MKNTLFLSLLILCIQQLFATSDSLHSVAYLKNLSVEQRIPTIELELKQLKGDEKRLLLEQIVQFAQTNKWQPTLAMAEKEFGLFHYKKGQYLKALQHYQSALLLFESLKDYSSQGNIYNLLATLSKKQKDYDRAIEYLDKTLEICTQIKDSSCIGTVYDNRGLIYAEQEDYKKAKEYYLMTLDIRLKLKDTVGLSYVYSNLAEVASNENHFELAQNYLHQSNVYKVLISDHFGQAVNFTNLGELYFKQEKYTQASTFFQESLTKSKQLNIPDLSQWNYRFLSRCHSAMGNTQLALDFLNQSHQLKDSLLSIEKMSQITAMETKFDTERKEQEIKFQKLEIENQQQRIRNQLVAGIALLTVLLFGFGSLFIHLRSRHKNKMQEAEITYQRQLLNTTIETQEKERIRISKDLHDGIGQQLSGLKMAWQQIGKSISNDNPERAKSISELSKTLTTTADEVRLISHQMMPKSLQEYGLVAATEDLLSNTFKNSSIEYDFQHHGIKDRFHQNIELSVYRILQELLNNIIKHAQASDIDIQLIKNNQFLLMIVEDNGIGIKEIPLAAPGHGLQNMQSRAQSVGGNIQLENALSGTIATLKISL